MNCIFQKIYGANQKLIIEKFYYLLVKMTQDNNFALIAFLFADWYNIYLFQLPGKIPEFKELQNTIGNGNTIAIAESQIFIIWVNKVS